MNFRKTEKHSVTIEIKPFVANLLKIKFVKIENKKTSYKH